MPLLILRFEKLQYLDPICLNHTKIFLLFQHLLIQGKMIFTHL